MDEHNDIQQALARPARDDFDDSDLEAELAELTAHDSAIPPPDGGGMNTSGLEKQLEKIVLDLPEVPDSSLDISIQEVKEAKESGL